MSEIEIELLLKAFCSLLTWVANQLSYLILELRVG